jgi:hypothetical protein
MRRVFSSESEFRYSFAASRKDLDVRFAILKAAILSDLPGFVNYRRVFCLLSPGPTGKLSFSALLTFHAVQMPFFLVSLRLNSPHVCQ